MPPRAMDYELKGRNFYSAALIATRRSGLRMILPAQSLPARNMDQINRIMRESAPYALHKAFRPLTRAVSRGQMRRARLTCADKFPGAEAREHDRDNR